MPFQNIVQYLVIQSQEPLAPGESGFFKGRSFSLKLRFLFSQQPSTASLLDRSGISALAQQSRQLPGLPLLCTCLLCRHLSLDALLQFNNIVQQAISHNPTMCLC